MRIFTMCRHKMMWPYQKIEAIFQINELTICWIYTFHYEILMMIFSIRKMLNLWQGSWMCSLLWLSVESNEKKIFLLILVFESPQLFTVEKPNRYWINRDVWIMYTGSSYDCCWMNKCARFNNTRNITNIIFF